MTARPGAFPRGRSRVGRRRKGAQALGIVLGLSMIAAACGGDDDDASSDDAGAEDGAAADEQEFTQGGDVVDASTFAQGNAEHIDPALSTTVSASQVGESIYDGLTTVDYSDFYNPEVVGVVAESWESNEDATEWTFTVREGLSFSDGTPVLPSSFTRAWERASDPDFAGDYSYLFSFIEGGQEKLDGEAETISGVTADDEAMTLTVRLSAPYGNFAYVAGFQLFFPMPSAVDDLTDPTEWENGLMIGHRPY